MLRKTRTRSPLRLLAAAATLVALGGTGAATAAARPAAAAPTAVVPVSAATGESTAIPGFVIQSSGKTGDTGGTISQPGYAASGWLAVSARSTVLAGLLQNNVYPDPFYSTNMRSIPTADFTVPWWYRADFSLGTETGLHTFVNVSGVLSKADVWVNGTQVATSGTVAGAYTQNELDLTAIVHSGVNSIAVKVYPNDPNRDLTMGWIDWVQTPPDKNMGIVRDVLLRRSGAVALRNAHVVTKLSTPALDSATLTAKADVRNDSAAAITATVAGSVAGTSLSQSVSLAAHETKTVTFPQVTLANPQVWWPAGMGAQPLYDLNLTASAGGTVTDAAHDRFGVRDVKAPLDASGHRRYSINGRPLQIRGGGWSPDLFLRWNPVYAEDKLRYALDLGLNTIRLEGHIEVDEFFDLTDRYGILTLPGWECCDKWEGQVNGSEPGDAWTSTDFPIAKASMAAEAARLRDHPSVISFLIGSDFAPDATIEKNYVDALNAADWSTPVIAAASDRSAPLSGSSGMKMSGPYDWIPPNYWYDKAHTDSGGAWGFNSETSAGPDVPTMDTLKRMMSSTELDTLWQSPNAAQYHRSSSSTFNTLKIFDNAVTGRYGAPTGLEDYVRKAQLAQYENVRAQFEAYRRNFTDSSNPADGVIYWMLNSGWTSLHWQLFDYYLDQNGAYYGAKKANEPLHVQYSYDSRSVVVVNQRHASAGGLVAKVNLYNPDGTEVFGQTSAALTVPGDGGRTTALTVPASISGIASTYLAKLVLLDAAGTEVSRNVYWLSTAADTVDWAKNDWYYAPTTSYANLKGLSGMAQAQVSATASSSQAGGTTTTTVTLRNTSTGKTPAFYLDAHVVNPAGKPVLPIQWDDNEISLWPGESKTLTASYRTSDLAGATPSVRVSGWNATTQTVPAGGGPDTEPPSAPGNLRSGSVTASAVGLAWDASTDNTGVTGYDVYRNGNPITTVTGTTATDTTVVPGTTYSYTVRAHDAAGNTSAPSNAISVTTPAGLVRYEAENATISQGTVATNHLGYSGTGFVDYSNVTGSYVQWSVSAPAAGTATVTLRFSNGTTTNRPMDIAVNGTVVAAGVAFNPTANWDTWQDVTVTLPVSAGTNTIRATATTANGGPNVDYLTVR
ncbi:CBM35 domain-containing protein [Dactylosporangium sp. NPDC051484]|uniref:glycosyl hydrolase 2 galactose-binding domain-containing protein n=1 Tax=Dactylosporangium sp. NPDC051484 TaxID=3154942 RepID=UPI00344DF962